MNAILYLFYTEENLAFKYFEFKLSLNNIYFVIRKIKQIVFI